MDLIENDLDIAPLSVVLQAVSDFAAALAETPQFQAFEQASERFRQDQAAQQAMQAYQQKQQSLRALLMLNAGSADQRAELERLQSVFNNQPVVQEFFAAQTDLAGLCQLLGINFATFANHSTC